MSQHQPDSAAAQTYAVSVLAVCEVNARMRRVTVGGESLAGFAPWPGQDVVLRLTDEGGAGVRRRYTVRHLDREGLRFDLDFVLHGPGPGARWATQVRVGERIEIFGPRGKVPLDGAGWQLFVGDESAIPAIAEMVTALPAGTVATALIDVTGAGDEQPIEATGMVDVRWLHRGTAAPGTADVLDQAMTTIALASADRHLYLFGESRTVRRLRDIANRRGVVPGEISAKGYWNLGRATRD